MIMIITQIMTTMITPNTGNTRLMSSSSVNSMERRVGGKLNNYPTVTMMSRFTTMKTIMTQMTQSRLFMIWTALR